MKLQAKNVNIPPLASLEFRQAVAQSLVGRFSSRQRGMTGIVQTQRLVVTLTQPEPRHTKWPKPKVENHTLNYRVVCEVHLCFTVARNCVQKFHNAKT